MEKNTATPLMGHRKEWFCIVFLFLYGFAIGLGHLNSLRRDDHTGLFLVEYLYGAAVMLACDQEFISPNEAQHPELQRFLKGEEEIFLKENLPENIQTHVSTVTNYHRYLVYLVGLIWRIFGISWRHIEVLNAVMLGWYASSVYILLRYFLSRLNSFIITLVYTLSPAVVIILRDLRDFSKAPFSITLFCLLLWLLANKSKLRIQLSGAFALGAVHGISLGFRQDNLVFLPLCMGILIFPLFLKHQGVLWKKILPLFIYLSMFFLLASPMLQRMEGGSQPQHVLVQGFADDRMDMLGMKHAPYQTLLSGADYYTFSVLADFAYRTPGLEKPYAYNGIEIIRAGHRWLQESVLLFPADIATRGWTSIIRILRYADAFPPSFSERSVLHMHLFKLHQFFALFMHRTGLILGIIALAVVAAKRPFVAFLIFFMTAYVTGYTSLQTVSRHSFHLSFFPFLVVGFLMETVICQIKQLKQSPQMIKYGRACMNSLAVLSLCAVLVFCPLYFLKWYQSRQLGPIFEQLIEAQRKPVAFSKSDQLGWSIFSLDSQKDSGVSTELHSLYKFLAFYISPVHKLWHVRSRYFMIEFENTQHLNFVLHKYESLAPTTDFSQIVHFPKTQQEGKILRYFFPVYEVLKPGIENGYIIARNSFTGFAIPEAMSKYFLGMYEITVPPRAARLMTFVSVDDEVPASLYLSPEIIPDPIFYYQKEQVKQDNTELAQAALHFGNKEYALLFSQAQFLLSKNYTTLSEASRNLQKLDHFEELLVHYLQIDPDDKIKIKAALNVLEDMANQKLYQNSLEQCHAALDTLDAIAPEKFPESAFIRVQAYERAGLKKEAIEVYTEYLQRYPENQAFALNAHTVISDFFSPEEKAAFWQRLIDSTPEQAYFYRYLALAYDLQNEEELAKEAYNTAYFLDPEDPKNKLCKVISDVDGTPMEELKEQISALAAAYPEEHFFITEQLEKEAWYLSEGGEHNQSGELLLLAANYSNNPDLFTLKALQQFTGAGEYERAEKGLLPLLESSLATEATQALYITTKLHRDFPDRFNFWLRLQKSNPDKHAVTEVLISVYEDIARGLFTSARLEELVNLPPFAAEMKEEKAFCLLYPAMARYIRGLAPLDTLQVTLEGLNTGRETIHADGELLAALLTAENDYEASERLRIFLDCIQR